jgi:hypothetical protein
MKSHSHCKHTKAIFSIGRHFKKWENDVTVEHLLTSRETKPLEIPFCLVCFCATASVSAVGTVQPSVQEALGLFVWVGYGGPCEASHLRSPTVDVWSVWSDNPINHTSVWRGT